MKKEDLILSKFKASEFIKSKEEAIRFFDAVLEIALGDCKKFFMKSFEDVINSFSGWEEYQALLSDQLAKQEGVEIIEELKVENKKLKDKFAEASKKVKELEERLADADRIILEDRGALEYCQKWGVKPLTQYKQMD